jgi:hypothetical protein
MDTEDQQASDLAVDIERVADEVKAQLQPGDQIGDLVVVSRRQLIAFATGAAGVGALAQFGISEAQAQEAAGQVGTSSEPVDAELVNATVANSLTDPAGTTHSGELADAGDTASSTSTASGYELTVEGDTYEFLE